MTDRIRKALERVHDASSWLAAHGLEDQEASAWPSAGDGPYVSSSGTSKPTEDAGIHDRLARAGDHQLATRILEQAASLLERGRERMTPYEATGEQCPTVAIDPDTRTVVARCQRVATHRSTGRVLCDRCDDWFRKPRNRGFHPGAEWVREGNRQIVRMCQCGPECCPQDDAGHTSCGDRAEEGRTVSRRCRQAQQRQRDRERALSE